MNVEALAHWGAVAPKTKFMLRKHGAGGRGDEWKLS